MKNTFNINTLIISFLLLVTIAVFSCKPPEPLPPYTYETNPKYTWGFAEFYGSYYSNYHIPNNVVSLNLFTEKLFVNDKNQLDGVGQYLIIQDVFSAPGDTLLLSGEYKVAETGEPFTFYSGKKFEDNREIIPSGAFVYYLEAEPTKSKIVYIVDGTMNISTMDYKTYTISCNFILDDKTELKGTFNSILDFYDKAAETPPSMERQRLQLKQKIN
ncbi:MAG TPA: hypothetical protein GXZ87_09195 [Bacteroidales bacterium]|nr:hypothetical protein [Bacteroidales bacterium]